MKCSLLFLILFAILTPYVYLQAQTCNNIRYKTELFTHLDIKRNIIYGQNELADGSTVRLIMDVYEPANDLEEARPLIITLFGGGFLIGDRLAMELFSESHARKGFVVANMEYRLQPGFSFRDSVEVYNAIARATSDLAAVIRFFREDAATENKFRINPDLIFAGGLSSGAITALQLAYLDEDEIDSEVLQSVVDEHGGLGGNTTNNHEYSYAIQGVLNYSGALKNANWIDENDPPLFSAHDEFDITAPYGAGFSPVFPNTYYMEGSSILHERLQEVGVASDLITIPNSTGHHSYFKPGNFEIYGDLVLDRTASFLYSIICKSTTATTIIKNQGQVSFFPSPSTGSVYITISGECTTDYEVEVFNMAGQLVYQRQSVRTLNLSNLPKGMYTAMVKFPKASRAPHIQKIILY